jgi:hypothetical protein
MAGTSCSTSYFGFRKVAGHTSSGSSGPFWHHGNKYRWSPHEDLRLPRPPFVEPTSWRLAPHLQRTAKMPDTPWPQREWEAPTRLRRCKGRYYHLAIDTDKDGIRRTPRN